MAVLVRFEEALKDLPVQIAEVAGDTRRLVSGEPNAEVVVANVGGEVVSDDALGTGPRGGLDDVHVEHLDHRKCGVVPYRGEM